tara:strand:- start:7 stop:693 length:687 start_codon:yes stop_codon:yes gene_type:complete
MNDFNAIDKKYFEPLLEAGVIKVPAYAKQVKIDVGLSHTAVNSLLWISNPLLADRHIFGFDPHPFINPYRTAPLGRYTYIPCGLNDSYDGVEKDFYLCPHDPGQSSLYEPNRFKAQAIVKAPFLSFKRFLDHFPWNRFPYIEHLKTDTQGHDLKILKSMGDHLTRVVHLEVECETYENEYKDETSKEQTQEYLEQMGFRLVAEVVIDQTYVNTRYLDIAPTLDNSRVE